MSLQRDNIGAQSQDGIHAKVGITYLPTNKTALIIPLQGDDCPTDPDEMVIDGPATYTLESMFKHIQPSVEVPIETGDESNPIQERKVEFKTLKSFEPDEIVDNVPELKAMKDKQNLIGRLEQLLQESSFEKILSSSTQKEALVDFLKAVVADIESNEKE